MINTVVLTIVTAITTAFNVAVVNPASLDKVLAERQISLEKRYAVKSVNEVMKKNILLNLAYLNQTVTKKADINWDEILKPVHFKFTLQPKEIFAYHDDLPKELQGKVAKTTKTAFNASDGYLSDGYLFGDGVCHLASVINWAAQDAGLKTDVPKDHNFAPIPEVPKEYGVSIYSDPGNPQRGANRNLYIENDKDYPVEFHFDYQDGNLKVFVTRA